MRRRRLSILSSLLVGFVFSLVVCESLCIQFLSSSLFCRLYNAIVLHCDFIMRESIHRCLLFSFFLSISIKFVKFESIFPHFFFSFSFSLSTSHTFSSSINVKPQKKLIKSIRIFAVNIEFEFSLRL